MTLIVCPLHEVAAALKIWRPSHVISLGSPGAEQAVIPADFERLALIFHDIAAPRPGLQAASADDVARLIAFSRQWRRDQPLLIQCWAGVSRSPAAAYVVACALSAPGQEGRLADKLRAAAPFATPNPRLVALADDLLSRNGAMVDAIARIGRGAETSLGSTFPLALA
ncbi:tyrosine phosphatase family protein [Phenylobacterium sp.]|uniref:tyrosine phosphatase family protein n=1 Tax=Phenylobacterium sp. TaxID=1871053 RepID=UPI0027315B57|nr:hypothetical protein [Phenylobacterium sp.]MDP1619255.1 hypothetical protein [Phenylobacterium sp.]MDP1989121.1 hypothetical protein [Phenylobacterium sp.]